MHGTERNIFANRKFVTIYVRREKGSLCNNFKFGLGKLAFHYVSCFNIIAL